MKNFLSCFLVLIGLIVVLLTGFGFNTKAYAQQPPTLSEAINTSTSETAPDSVDNKIENSDVSDSENTAANPPPIADETVINADGTVGFDDPNAVVPQKTEEEIKAELRRKAFAATIDGAIPLKPNEIRKLLEAYDETVQATETPIYPDPEPISSFTRASIEPGAKPVIIKTAVGSVTTVSIVDMSGQPWPIQDLTWAGNFQVEQPEVGGHMLRITPTSKFATGNVSMRLVGLNPPVIFTLRTERKSVHVRLDVQIPEMGPRASVPLVDTPVTTKAGNDFMTAVLLGVVNTKNGTERLTVAGVDGRTSAFSQDGMIYVRTPYTLLSPAWSQSVQSTDGTKVYAMNYTPVLILSDKGKMVKAYISHKEQSDDQY